MVGVYLLLLYWMFQRMAKNGSLVFFCDCSSDTSANQTPSDGWSYPIYFPISEGEGDSPWDRLTGEVVGHTKNIFASFWGASWAPSLKPTIFGVISQRRFQKQAPSPFLIVWLNQKITPNLTISVFLPVCHLRVNF